VTVKFVDVLDGELAETVWTLYRAAFAGLDALAAQRHLMHRSEFDTVVADPRVDKVLALDDAGALAGVASYTNDLDAVPLISPAYFRQRWPEAYEQRRIWYIGFLAVDPAAQGGGTFTDLFTELYQVASPRNGLVAMDICTYNDDVHHLPTAIKLLLRRSSGGRARSLLADAQSYWVFDTAGETLS
jgi:hypothetical protein